MTTSEASWNNNCASTCELYSYCKATQEITGIYPPVSSAEIEAENIILQARQDMDAFRLEADRNLAKYDASEKLADNPEKLARALQWIEEGNEQAKTVGPSVDIIRQKTLDFVAKWEQETHDLTAAADLHDNIGCPGPQEVKVRRFFGRRTMTVCGLAHTNEFKRAQIVRNSQEQFLREHSAMDDF